MHPFHPFNGDPVEIQFIGWNGSNHKGNIRRMFKIRAHFTIYPPQKYEMKKDKLFFNVLNWEMKKDKLFFNVPNCYLDHVCNYTKTYKHGLIV